MTLKRSLNFALVIISFLGTACSLKLDKAKGPDFRMPEVNIPNDNKEIDQMVKDYMAVLGGEPGKIQIRGQAVQLSANNQMLLDNRITTSQTEGKNNSKVVKTEISDLSKTFLTNIYDNTTTVDAAKSEYYVNLNCDNLDLSLVAGLKELKPVDIAHKFEMTAKMVFLCKDVRFPMGMLSETSIFADSVVMTDVDTNFYGDLGGISIFANKLTLVGKNRLATKGLNQASMMLSAPEVIIEVHDSLEGSGTLEVSSVGGNRLDAKSPIKVSCEVNSIEAGKQKNYNIDLDDVMQGQQLNLQSFNIDASLSANKDGILNILNVELDDHKLQKQKITQNSEYGILNLSGNSGDAKVSVFCHIL